MLVSLSVLMVFFAFSYATCGKYFPHVVGPFAFLVFVLLIVENHLSFPCALIMCLPTKKIN